MKTKLIIIIVLNRIQLNLSSTEYELTRNEGSSAVRIQVCHGRLLDSTISLILPAVGLCLSGLSPWFSVAFCTSSGCVCSPDGAAS